jgi:hypothetical protein
VCGPANDSPAHIVRYLRKSCYRIACEAVGWAGLQVAYKSFP